MPNDHAQQPRFNNASFFIWLISIAAIWAHTSQPKEVYQYWLHFDPVQTPAIILATLTAFASALFPTRTYVFLVFCVVQLVTILIRFPNVPTHIVMELILSASVIGAFLLLCYRQKSPAVHYRDLFHAYAPVARWLLIIMYFFGTFHKINPGFLSLESSCAIPFIYGFPIPDSLLSAPWVGYSAIYGTLILEFIAMLLLLNRRTKYYGMLLGMPFHIMIGLSSFGVLAHFSVLAIALHATFLPSDFGKRVLADKWLPRFMLRADSYMVITFVVVLLQFLLARFSLWSLMNIEFLIVAVVVFTLILRHGKFIQEDQDYRLISTLKPINLFAVLFLLQSAGPYLGLSTTGAVQMFSGLRTEGGISNHYIVTQPLYLFPYQKDVVYFDDMNDEFLDSLAAEGLAMNMFNFKEYVSRPTTKVRLPIKLRVNEESFTIATVDDFKAFANRYFVPYHYLERKFLHFKLIDSPHPRQCRH